MQALYPMTETSTESLQAVLLAAVGEQWLEHSVSDLDQKA